jgi:hypothetical protein
LVGAVSYRGKKERKIIEMVKACLMDINGLGTKDYLNIIPLRSYDCLIGMDCLDLHHVVLYCYNKAFTYLDKEGNLKTIQSIPRVVTIKEFPALQLKKIYMKRCQVFAVHMEESPKGKVPM